MMLTMKCDAVSRNIEARCPVQLKMGERENRNNETQSFTIDDVVVVGTKTKADKFNCS